MQNKKSKRDWQVYGLYRKDEEILFLERVKKTVWNMDAPWKPKTGGRSAFPTKAKVMCAMLKVKFGFDYRSMESHLRSRPDLLEIMGLQKAPSKTVINDSLKRIPISYLRKVNARLTEPIKKRTWLRTARGLAPKGVKPGLTSRQTGTNPKNLT